MNVFQRRSYNFTTLGQDLVNVLRSRKGIKTAKQHLSESFVRHIMLASTAINQCRICAWGHTLSGLESGDDYREMASILDQSLVGVPEEEIPALKFAMFYAENEGDISREQLQQLYHHYGSQAIDIIHIVRMINFGNLSGNTVDAFQARLEGQEVRDGSYLLEFVFYVFGGTVFRYLMKSSSLFSRMRKEGLIR